VLIAKINCVDEADICQFYEVHSYPQIIHFSPFENIFEVFEKIENQHIHLN